MNNSEWCVIFAINDKVQNFTTCYNTTEVEARGHILLIVITNITMVVMFIITLLLEL